MVYLKVLINVEEIENFKTLVSCDNIFWNSPTLLFVLLADSMVNK